MLAKRETKIDEYLWKVQLYNGSKYMNRRNLQATQLRNIPLYKEIF